MQFTQQQSENSSFEAQTHRKYCSLLDCQAKKQQCSIKQASIASQIQPANDSIILNCKYILIIGQMNSGKKAVRKIFGTQHMESVSNDYDNQFYTQFCQQIKLIGQQMKCKIVFYEAQSDLSKISRDIFPHVIKIILTLDINVQKSIQYLKKNVPKLLNDQLLLKKDILLIQKIRNRNRNQSDNRVKNQICRFIEQATICDIKIGSVSLNLSEQNLKIKKHQRQLLELLIQYILNQLVPNPEIVKFSILQRWQEKYKNQMKKNKQTKPTQESQISQRMESFLIENPENLNQRLRQNQILPTNNRGSNCTCKII